MVPATQTLQPPSLSAISPHDSRSDIKALADGPAVSSTLQKDSTYTLTLPDTAIFGVSVVDCCKVSFNVFGEWMLAQLMVTIALEQRQLEIVGAKAVRALRFWHEHPPTIQASAAIIIRWAPLKCSAGIFVLDISDK